MVYIRTVEKKDFLSFVEGLILDDELEVVGPTARGESFVFKELESAEDLRLDYDCTILPPKKYFLPVYEVMRKFDLSDPRGKKVPAMEKTRVILGMHPYDIVAVNQMDKYFLNELHDSNYRERRVNTIIIGLNVVNVSKKAFFGAMGTGRVSEGWDLMLTDLGDKVAVEVGTERGAKLIEKCDNLMEAGPEVEASVADVVDRAISKSKRGLKVPPEAWHDLIRDNPDSPVWKEKSEKCLSCGTCTLVCPTCFCYDMVDGVDIKMSGGHRVRTWDGCMLRSFTEVAGGEVFRDTPEKRYRHRFNRKANYLPDMLGFIACVGCGRCSTQCVPDIADPVQFINDLYDSAKSKPEKCSHTPHTGKNVDAEGLDTDIDVLEPMPAVIKRIEKFTEIESLFEIELESGKPLGHKPGQFVEVSIPGYGEAPISVSSAPGGKSFELVVRNVGDVTGALHNMNVGDAIGIRGPFGNGFDAEALKGEDLLFIGGGLGIVPMRSLINHVLDNRDRYGKVIILYGAKQPCDILFKDEVRQWDERPDIVHKITVDKCPADETHWYGDVGLITTLIPKVDFDPEKTYAIVVGPPVMYKFVVADLLKRGVGEDHIIVSLERRMKCGVGKCGHCQINGVYVCKDGPVFLYKDIKDLPEALS